MIPALKLPVILAALLATVSPLFSAPSAAEQKVRIDISGLGRTKIELAIVGSSAGASVSHAKWLEENQTKAITAQFPATTSWQKGSITFKPAATGTVTLAFLGPHVLTNAAERTLRPVFAQFDDVKTTPTNLKNGSFERIAADGVPAEFSATISVSGNPPIPDENQVSVRTGDAAEGTRYIRVWHNARLTQGISVTKDVPVTVTFSYRLDK